MPSGGMNEQKMTSLLLALLVLAACLPALAQGVSSQDVALAEGLELTSAAYVEGQLLLGGSALYGWRPGEDGLRLLQELQDGPWQQANGLKEGGRLLFVADGDQLYALALEEGLLFEAALTDAGLRLGRSAALDTQVLMQKEGDLSFMSQPVQLLAVNGRLYILARGFGPLGMDTVLVSYDAHAGGEATLHGLGGVQQMAAYRDGRLLCLVTEEGAMPMLQGTPRLVDYDPSSDTRVDLGETGVSYQWGGGPMVWDAGEDLLYLSNGASVYRHDSKGRVDQVAYLIPGNAGDNFSGQMQLLLNQQLAVISRSNLALRPASKAVQPAASLRIYGAQMDEAHQMAMRTSQVPVSFVAPQALPSAQQFAQALVSGADEVDIFMLSSD